MLPYYCPYCGSLIDAVYEEISTLKDIPAYKCNSCESVTHMYALERDFGVLPSRTVLAAFVRANPAFVFAELCDVSTRRAIREILLNDKMSSEKLLAEAFEALREKRVKLSTT